VYAYTRSGERTRAIRELENWLKQNPRDRAAILWLARLLTKAGGADAVSRYRQLPGSGQAGGRQ
jgi:hypothetical protein